MNTPTRIIVGMSGGVDSSVTALLLQQQGYAVEGLFMKNWEEDDTDTYCSATQDIADAQAVCDKINIPLHKVNFAAEYWEHVFEHFLAEYQAGRTPNPDILCNREIKFKAFLDYAQHLGASHIAMGHYARSQYQDGYYQLHKGLDPNKDQSYFLYALNQHQLSHALFPLGHYHKHEVRELARKAGLLNHDKKDSTGICFIGERKFQNFLQDFLPAQPGFIVSVEGEVLGEHLGLMYYTLGQRRGLKLGGQSNYDEKAWYVLKKDIENNQLIVGQGLDHPWLYRQQLTCTELSWISDHMPTTSCQLKAKIRYRQHDQACSIEPVNETTWKVNFVKPQRAIAPGQAIVFYHHDECLGGGVICT